MKTRALIIHAIALLYVCATAAADTVHLKTGRSLTGVILKEDANEVVLLVKVTTVTLHRREISSIEKTKPEEVTKTPKGRLADWASCLSVAARQKWTTGLRPIPATVIDKGILKNVPYKSFKCGDYEINIYGDPDQPACLEIGVRNELLKDLEAKNNCLKFIQSVLSDAGDRSFLMSLKLDKDLKKREGLTFEITPETDEDAFGGWWVSVYDERLLNASRASDKELKAITVTRGEVKKGTEASKAGDDIGWNANDFRYARPAAPGAGQEGGGLVYVRGYTRKDGTYVQPHTRSAPSRGRK